MAEPANIRKTYEICRSVLRNAAFYTGGSARRNSNDKSQFAIVASNNFLDMAFLEWCKIFADRRGKHHWAKILPPGSDFHDALLKRLGLDSAEFETLLNSVRHYRDKEIAHADEYDVVDIPLLKLVVQSAIFLYERLRIEYGLEPQPAAPDDLNAVFVFAVDDARQNFAALATVPKT